VVMLLWNWLMPAIFGLTKLTYWQAWGLLILSSILFKDLPSGGDDSGKKTDRRRRRELRKLVDEEVIRPDNPPVPEEPAESGDAGSPDPREADGSEQDAGKDI